MIYSTIHYLLEWTIIGEETVKQLTNNPKTILDVTQELLILTISAYRIKKSKIIGIDISEGMINVGKKENKKKRS